jgi:hypothetical protein
MSTVPAVLIWLSCCGVDADDLRLVEARAALTAYLSQIDGIRVKYTENVRTKRRDRPQPVARDRKEALVLERARKAKQPSQIITTHDYVEIFPNWRHITREEHRYADAPTRIIEDHGSSVNHRVTHVLPHVKQANSRQGEELPLATPLNAIGWRIDGSRRSSLADLLHESANPVVEGTETIRGWQCLKVHVPAPIPKELRPAGWTDIRSVVMFLAKDHGYMPVRWAIHQKGDPRGEIKIVYENFDIVPAEDENRPNNIILFPRRIDSYNDWHENTWTIDTIRLNPKVSADSLQVSIPPDFPDRARRRQ